MELLARPGCERLRFIDVARELGLTQATVHAILKTLSDRGWVSRDPVDKTFSLGPALAAVAGRADVTRTLTNAARATTVELTAELGYPVSVLERHGDSLLITAYEGGDPSSPSGHPGERIPYAPPFGVAFAAWDSEAEQRNWIERTAEAGTELADDLARSLARTRDRGYDVDLTTPALAKTAQVLGALQRDGLPAHVRKIVDQLLVETVTGSGDHELGATPVATIAAPVFDRHHEVALIVGVHPFQVQTAADVATIGDRLVIAATAISATGGETPTSLPRRAPRP